MPPFTAASVTALHRARSKPQRPLSHERLLTVCYAFKALFDRYSTATTTTFDPELYAYALEIEKEIIYWETRSAKLNYAARRQAAYRRARLPDDFEHGDTVNPDTPPAPPDIIPASTAAAIARYREQREEADQAPDTSGYRDSGLV